MDPDLKRGIFANLDKFEELIKESPSLPKQISVDDTATYSEKYTEGTSLPIDISDDLKCIAESHHRVVRNAKKSNHSVMYLGVDMVNEITATKMNNPESFLINSLLMLQNTYFAMIATTHVYNVERSYQMLYDEMKTNRHDWECFFHLDNNQWLWAERTCGMLGNFAAIHRQRASYAMCEEIMELYRFVIDRYVEHINSRKAQGLSDVDEVVCCRELVYKYHRVAVNLAVGLKRCEGMDETYRCLIQYEIDTGLSGTEGEEFSWMLTGNK
jgi:hypothetical protein